MPVIHRQGYTVRKAEKVLHTETRRQTLTRHWWAIRGLLVAHQSLADVCPSVAAGRARLALAVRDAEFTVEHRPVSLRILLAECFTCPDPDPLEPIMPTDPQEAEVTYAAALNTLARLRHYAAYDPHLRGVMGEFDQAVASGLGIEPAAVAARTRTEPAPTAREEAFEELLKASSLGQTFQVMRERSPDDGSFDAIALRLFFDRALADLYAERDGEASVELLSGLSGHIHQQVRLVLGGLAEIAERAQALRPRTSDPAPGS